MRHCCKRFGSKTFRNIPILSEIMSNRTMKRGVRPCRKLSNLTLKPEMDRYVKRLPPTCYRWRTLLLINWTISPPNGFRKVLLESLDTLRKYAILRRNKTRRLNVPRKMLNSTKLKSQRNNNANKT